MARISEKWTVRNDTAYGSSTLGTDWVDTNNDGQKTSDELISNDIGKSTVIYKMMQLTKQDVDPSWGEQLSDTSKIQFEQHFKRVYPPLDYSYKAYGGVYGIIGIFEVNY
jgi:hypothetical protein